MPRADNREVQYFNSAVTYKKQYSEHSGVRRNFLGKGQRRRCAYPFKVTDNTMQMDVYKTLYPCYTTKNAPY